MEKKAAISGEAMEPSQQGTKHVGAHPRVRSVGLCMLSTSGGSSIMASEIGWRLRQRGVEVFSCHCSSDSRLSDGAMILSKEYSFYVQRNLDTDRCFVAGLDICSQILAWHHANPFELLHIHSLPVFGLPAFHLKRIREIPYIVTFHGSDILNERLADHNREMIRAILTEADAVTCISEYLASALHVAFPDLPRAHVVHNFLRHEFEAVPSRTQGISHRYLHVSSLRPVKRPELLAEAFRLVHAEQPDAHLRLVTTRQGAIRAADLMKRFNPEPPIELVEGEGEIDNLSSEYRGATALVLTSRFESFGLVILEALAHGLPVVAPATGGITEGLGEDWPLLVEETSDPRAYARAMLAASSPQMQSSLVERASRIKCRFDGRQHIDGYVRLYEQALQRRA